MVVTGFFVLWLLDILHLFIVIATWFSLCVSQRYHISVIISQNSHYPPSNRTFLEVDNMVVSWWIYSGIFARCILPLKQLCDLCDRRTGCGTLCRSTDVSLIRCDHVLESVCSTILTSVIVKEISS